MQVGVSYYQSKTNNPDPESPYQFILTGKRRSLLLIIRCGIPRLNFCSNEVVMRHVE